MVSLWDILWILFMLGIVVALVVVGMKEKAARKKNAPPAPQPQSGNEAASGSSDEGSGEAFPADEMQFEDFK